MNACSRSWPYLLPTLLAACVIAGSCMPFSADEIGVSVTAGINGWDLWQVDVALT